MTRKAHGFTLVELLIVVAIISVLAVVAGTAYRRYMDSARTTEAFAMLGEIRMKEEAYRAERSAYYATSADESLSSGFPIVDGAVKEPCYKDVTTPPAAWTLLGINPGKTRLQCGYNVLAGAPSAGTLGTMGQGILGGATAPATPWWYAVATCDNDGSTTTNATFTTGFNTTVVSAQNEHQ
jgi:prepilin-type N-terminal cleavage/methylation domain-containing protein